MILKVNKDICEIKQNEVWNVGDYNVHTVQVELSEEFDGLVNKVRYFVEDNSYDMLITDNIAEVPREATLAEGIIKIGVYGYDADTDILVQSTSPVNKYISSGTYTGDPDNTEPLTPTDKQQMESAIQKNADDIINLQNNKQDILISGENIKTINNESILGNGNIEIDVGSINYNDLENKPKINNIELKGNKTLNDLGIQPSGNYATRNDLTEESRAIFNEIETTYYNKNQTNNLLNNKQNTLISGQNIKTINNESILGSGNIEIGGGGGGTSPLADKNIVVFGDSLTDPQSGGTSWTESFINIAEYNSFRGYGRGYCTWTLKNNTEYNITDNTDANVGSNVIWNQFNKLKHDVDNNNTPIPDIIMIFCADNDILQSKTIGSESATFKAEAQSSDVKTLTNMMDSIRYNIDTINAEYPNCIIVPIIPLLPSQYARSKTYRDALITCYNNLGLSYIDVMYGSGIAWYREVMKKTYFANDGVHLSEAGSMKVAKFIYQSLITMPRIQKLPSTTTNKGLYNVYYNFTNATSTNSFASVMQGEPYRATISATTGYSLTSVTCTMGGVSQPVEAGVINIASVTGNITITAVGGSPTPTTYTITNNLTNATSTNEATSISAGEAYTATISPLEHYTLDSLTCTMGGVAQTITNNTINIASVSGNIVITAIATQFVPVEGAYIHNDGDCWVGTSYYPTQATTRLELVADVHSFSENFAYLVGSTSTKLCRWDSGNVIGCVAGGASQTITDLVRMSYDKKFTLNADIANKALTITDEYGTRTSSITVGTTFVENPMWYFAGYWKNNFEHKSGDMKIYSFKIWEGNTLVYAGYPISDSTGAGIYDAVSGTTNYNEGTGTLTYGVDSAS